VGSRNCTESATSHGVRASVGSSPAEPAFPGGSVWLSSLADGLFVAGIFGVGWIALGRRTWFEQPGITGYLVMLASGVAISVGVEWTTVHALRWWTHGEQMPLVPIVNIGLVPMVQTLVLPPLIFRGVTVVSRYVDGRRASMRTVRAGCHEGQSREEIQREDCFDPVSPRETRRPASSNGTI